MEKPKTCENCKYYQGKHCYKFPQTVLKAKTEWCGFWEDKSQENKKNKK